MIRTSALVLVSILLSLTPQGRGQPTSPPAASQPWKPYVVCTSAYWPLTSCDLNNATAPSGYEIELFSRTVNRLHKDGDASWAPGNWSWACWSSWDDMLVDIQKTSDEDRKCDVIVAGVSATTERKNNMQFSAATFQSGRRIMVHIDNSRGMWSFLEPFETSLWLACFGTSAFVGALLLISESRLMDLWRAPPHAMRRAATMQWGALSMLLRMANTFSPSSTGGRFILAGYGFLVYILTSMYISSSSAILSKPFLNRDYKDMQDLISIPVGIFQDDKTAFSQFALNDVVYYAWATDADERAMLHDLRKGKINALVLDAPWVKYTAADKCDLFMVGDLVLPVDLGFAFPTDTSIDLHAFDGALGILDGTGVKAQLERAYLLPPGACHSGQMNAEDVSNPQIKLSQVSGLWIFLAGTVGLGLLSHLISFVWNYSAKQRAAELARARQSLPMGSKGSFAAGQSLSRSSSRDLDGEGDRLLSNPATADEALQALNHQLRQVDNLIRHLPFVIAATMDSRLADLRSQLMTSGAIVPGSTPMPQWSGPQASARHRSQLGQAERTAINSGVMPMPGSSSAPPTSTAQPGSGANPVGLPADGVGAMSQSGLLRNGLGASRSTAPNSQGSARSGDSGANGTIGTAPGPATPLVTGPGSGVVRGASVSEGEGVQEASGMSLTSAVERVKDNGLELPRQVLSQGKA